MEPPAAAPPPDQPAGPPDAAAPAPRRRRAWRFVRLLAGSIVVVAVALLVALSVIDVGPYLEARAEREGSRLIDRPLHIGRLSARIVPGRFVLEDVRIDGLEAGHVPFFTARRIVVWVPWWTAFRGELFIDGIVVSDWTMQIETWPDRHSLIRIPRRTGTGPSRFVTTMQLLRAERGRFTYLDHGTPWSIVARDLDLTLGKVDRYRGECRSRGGTIRIQEYEPMAADFACSFAMDGGKVHFDRIDLDTDGARSVVTGDLDLGRWPEQLYQVDSLVQLPRMRAIFWAGYTFGLTGETRFTGTFHLFKGGREVQGRFASAEAGLDGWRFPQLQGQVRWTRDRLDVTETTAGFYGGRLALTYTIAPLGVPQPAIARLDTRYERVDLETLSDAVALRGIRPAGRAEGRNLLEWPIGAWAQHRGEGWVGVRPPDGVALAARALPDDMIALHDARPPAPRPFNPATSLGPLPLGGTMRYRIGPDAVEVEPSEMATPASFVAFAGRTGYGGGAPAAFEFDVTSRDWQESDRVLAGIITAFGSPTRAVEVGGFGTFSGRMTGSFSRPRVTGRFAGERLRGWDVTWGRAEGDIVVENSYVDVSDTVITSGEARFDVDGRFALGYPRRDGGEEIDARITAYRWPLKDIKHAFLLDDYDYDGVASGEYHVYGMYETPWGFGRMQLDDLVAYGERFGRVTAGLRFEGPGVRLDAIEAGKGTGTITGAAFVKWEGSYSFNADGTRIPVEALDALAVPDAPPLTGLVGFKASGSGVFLNPTYEVRVRVADLFVGDEGIGQLSGRLTVRDNLLTLDQFEVASARLAVSGSGRVGLLEGGESDFLLRFTDTSLDPYVRAFRPAFSPFTSLVGSGTLRLSGVLSDPARRRADVVVEQGDLRVFDYRMRNDGNLRVSLEGETVRVERMRVVGEGTAFELFGEVGLGGTQRMALRGLGNVNLGVLQGFFRDLRSGGDAEVQVDVRGTLGEPVLMGSAIFSGGRVRHFALPHALEALTGRVEFDAGGLRFDDVTARIGGGRVTFGGRVAFEGFTPSTFALTATGTDMRIRYPAGFQSRIDADLALRGSVSAPTLSGTVAVRSGVWSGGVDTGGTDILGLVAAGGAATEAPGAPGVPVPSAFPLRFDVRVTAPSTLRIENRDARLLASADVALRGTYDRPLLFGRVEVERGEVLFEGNRYQVTRGTVDFANPTRIEPFFDLEAETRVRVPGETYRVILRGTGTPASFTGDLTSDPPLSEVDILALLFGDVRDPSDPELNRLRTPGRAEQDLLAARATRLLASPISSEVGRVVEETFGVDSVVITPSLGDPATLSLDRLAPSARVTIGKRLSERLYLTFSQALSTSTLDQIILVEYNQSDRLSWIVSQNEDRTYAFNVLVRHVF
jgi:hypothetical protein